MSDRIDWQWATVRNGIRVFEGSVFPEPPDDACGDKRGTPAGAQRHRYRNEKPCDECLNARQAYSRDRERFRNRRTATCEDCGTDVNRRSIRCTPCSITARTQERKAA